jgi:hypothetical protein
MPALALAARSHLAALNSLAQSVLAAMSALVVNANAVATAANNFKEGCLQAPLFYFI